MIMTCFDRLKDQDEIAAWLGQDFVAEPPVVATASPLHHAVDAETRVLKTVDQKHRIVHDTGSLCPWYNACAQNAASIRAWHGYGPYRRRLDACAFASIEHGRGA
jgi:hypothetical protein